MRVALIKNSFDEKYLSLKGDRERLQFLYEMQEKLRVEFNEMGRAFRDKEIDEVAFVAYKKQWRTLNLHVSEMIAPLRVEYFTKEFGYASPTKGVDDGKAQVLLQAKEELKGGEVYKTDIQAIWQ